MYSIPSPQPGRALSRARPQACGRGSGRGAIFRARPLRACAGGLRGGSQCEADRRPLRTCYEPDKESVSRMPQGTLFTEDFLNEGIQETDAWRRVTPDAVAAFRQSLRAIFKEVADPGRLNEAQTEERIVKPILESLGWHGCFWVQERLETTRLCSRQLKRSEVRHASAASRTLSSARYRRNRVSLSQQFLGRCPAGANRQDDP
jgi:hypothetical protein